LEAEQRRDRQALLSTIGVAVGLAGLGVAGYMFLEGKPQAEQRPTTSRRPALRVDTLQLQLAGSF
jgi:hypothetical protein